MPSELLRDEQLVCAANSDLVFLAIQNQQALLRQNSAAATDADDRGF
jgi:hypothetical protein